MTSIHRAGSLAPAHQIVPVGQFGNKTEPCEFGPRVVERKIVLLGGKQGDEPILRALRQPRKIFGETRGRVAPATAGALARRVGAQAPQIQEFAPTAQVIVLFGGSRWRGVT